IAVEDRQNGTFACQEIDGHGFLRPSARNRFRMEYEDGTPFYPIGVQTCNLLLPDCDGPCPEGKDQSVSNAEWLKRFAGAVNLVRTQFGQATHAGCAFPLIPVKAEHADRYDIALARQLDEAFILQRKHGISQILIFFQDMSLWSNGRGKCIFGPDGGPESYKRLGSPSLPLQEKYIRYIVARYAAFIDIWEIFNEDSFAEEPYLAHLAKLIRSVDPYRHPITTNYAHPNADWCEIITFHEYMGMPANEVDAYLASQFAIYKSFGKVVQNTEFGNQRYLSNVDPVKWRIAVWTAFMHECGLLFWSMSQRQWKKGEITTMNANAYLGADSRRHFRVLDDFTRELPIDLRPTPTGFTTHFSLRLYGLSNGRTSVLYVHHYADHTVTYKHGDPLLIWTGPGKFRMRWINPETGRTVALETIDNPQQFLEFKLPPIKIDLACRIDRLE
ncbi:MAG: hypothetical protein FWD53_12050, partial [Phycisphaerales bacterium]|nr:hypothetical protein [Phycisphaerales bacterium]